MTHPIQTYLDHIRQNLDAGIATEHTHRPALQALLESLTSGADAAGIRAINEPRRLRERDPAARDFTSAAVLPNICGSSSRHLRQLFPTSAAALLNICGSSSRHLRQLFPTSR
jgi:hypothetical protein